MAKLTITIEAEPCSCGVVHHKPDVKVEIAYDAEGLECNGLRQFQEIAPKLLHETVGKLVALETVIAVFGAARNSTPEKEPADAIWPSELHPTS